MGAVGRTRVEVGEAGVVEIVPRLLFLPRAAPGLTPSMREAGDNAALGAIPAAGIAAPDRVLDLVSPAGSASNPLLGSFVTSWITKCYLRECPAALFCPAETSCSSEPLQFGLALVTNESSQPTSPGLRR